MVCIYCRTKTKTSNSRATRQGSQVWRRRSCPSCHAVFTTREAVDLAEAVRVRTAEGRLVPFARDKLFLSLYTSLSHRKTALPDAGQLAATIFDALIPHIKDGAIGVTAVTAQTFVTLERFDKASAVYYRAHHDSATS